MIIILLGPPGSGKGTQANFIQNKLSIPHLSTGDILRQSVKNKTELGNIVKNVMAKGELVSDELVLQIIKERISQNDCDKGFILDGYPRNKTQSDFLFDFLQKNKIDLDLIIDFKADTETIKNRIIERSKIENRSDDNLEVIKTRLEKYFAETKPLAVFFKDNFEGKFFEINAMQEISIIQSEIENRLKNA